MRISKVLMAAAAVTMMSAPALSAAPSAPVSKLSVTRAAPTAGKQKGLGGSGLIIALLAAAAVIAGIVIAADKGSSR